VKETLSVGLENIKRELLEEIKTKIYEIVSGTYSVADEKTVLKILATYGGTREWEEFKKLLAYELETLEAALRKGRDIGCEPDRLLPIAAARSLKKWNKADGKPPADIANYNIDPAAVEKYLIELSNQSPEASTIISSYMEK
jgi:hypothetical protein